MARMSYEIRGGEGSWTVSGTSGPPGLDYLTKEAAFEAAVGSAMNALREGHEIVITVPGARPDGTTLGNESVQPL
ncbi:hypothetical protein [Prosthecomicrobium sp. N25]|uniref:hypothetical protein n=1 Tax=Prosthecomicrobium sp. N25 TaxID=3129254 RepID=UPI0030768CDF